jgi:hypothetical protein
VNVSGRAANYWVAIRLPQHAAVPGQGFDISTLVKPYVCSNLEREGHLPQRRFAVLIASISTRSVALPVQPTVVLVLWVTDPPLPRAPI